MPKDGSSKTATFVKKLDERVGDMEVDELMELMALLQQDRKGKPKGFSESQIEVIMSHCAYKGAKCTLDKGTMKEVLDALSDPERISVMHQIGRKQLQVFILLLSKRQTQELVQHMAPFFMKHTDQFVESLTVDQKAEVFPHILPCALEWAREQGSVAQLLAALYDPPDIATAIEYHGHGEKIAGKREAAAVDDKDQE